MMMLTMTIVISGGNGARPILVGDKCDDGDVDDDDDDDDVKITIVSMIMLQMMMMKVVISGGNGPRPILAGDKCPAENQRNKGATYICDDGGHD